MLYHILIDTMVDGTITITDQAIITTDLYMSLAKAGLSWRALTIYATLIIIFCIVMFRIFAIQFNDRDFLGSKGERMLNTSRVITALRGGIYDRNNFPLAVSVVQYNLFALRNFSNYPVELADESGCSKGWRGVGSRLHNGAETV